MIKVENIEVWGFHHAIRGMRNPLNSWDRCDTKFSERFTTNIDGVSCDEFSVAKLGENDLDLMKRLYKGGSEHRKYLRMIFASMDITAPLYWWKEADTYKIGTVSNSCSTMHTIHKKEFDIDDFSHEHLIFEYEGDRKEHIATLKNVIKELNNAREAYLATKDKRFWWIMIQYLPSSYNQKRTITMNYENAVTMIKQRTGHKLDEWNDFVEVLSNLPYLKEIMGE